MELSFNPKSQDNKHKYDSYEKKYITLIHFDARMF